MKPLKLFMNCRPQEQPDNTYPFGKNGVQNDLDGSSFNEPGFLALAAAIVPYTLMGVVETDSKPVLFSTNNTNSAVGYFNPSTRLYEPIVDDSTWSIAPAKLPFNMDFYITGTAQRNYKGEMVVAFTDKRTLPSFPFYLNCDNPNILRLDDLRLFPFYNPPTFALEESSGGTLEPGTYYVSGVYEKNDGTTTPHFEISSGITIAPGSFNTTSDKAILITITGADTNFNFIRLSIISKVKGIVTAVELSDAVSLVGGTLQVFYTGDNISSQISVADIITPAAVYSKVGTMGQLNDSLYIADLEKEPDLDDMQPYALMIGIDWVSEMIDATSPPLEHRNGTKRSFMHQEVYALYVRYRKTRGGFTKAFTIPGLPPLPGDLATSTEAVLGGDTSSTPKFKIEDTIPAFNAIAKTGKPGVWRNEVETYPDTIEFDAQFISGRNLRGQPVLHHRMPSLRWCKANLYSSDPEYGKTKLDLLGIKVSGVVIPAKYADVIDGYQILYAKRNSINSTIDGQTVLMHGEVTLHEEGLPTGLANIYTTGGNWSSFAIAGDHSIEVNLTSVRLDTFRLHPFELLFNRPSITPKFISAQWKMRRNNLRTEGYYEDGTDGDPKYNMPTVILVDYTLGVPPLPIASGRMVRSIKQSFYLDIGFNIFRFSNNHHEICYAGVLNGPNWPLVNSSAGIRLRGQNYTEPEVGCPEWEETYLVNLVAIKTDMYSNFYSQALVTAGEPRLLADTSVMWGGDSFCCDYTFHTYGRHDSLDTNGDGIKGKKVIRRIVCESSANIHLRYEIPGNEYSKWYPRTSIVGNSPDQCYITRFDRAKDPNQFGYTKDLNALNDFVSSTIFNPFLEQITKFPFRIHRGGKVGRQNKFRNWRSFLPLDYYECQKNMGNIIHLEGMDDRLLIHHENALFRTQDKAKLDAGQLSVTIGTGDIFQFEPQEPVSSKLGYAGTQNDLACIRTPFGYVFTDAKQGELYIYKDVPKGLTTQVISPDITNIGADISTFLRDNFKGLTGKNVYTGNGITIGWDTDYKRILITVKNKKDPSEVPIKLFQDTDAFFDALEVDDLVNYNGRIVKYKGLNDFGETGFNCPDDPPDPDVLIWVADESYCESDEVITPITLVSEFSSMPSPGALLYKQSTNEMFVADYDNGTNIVYKINLTDASRIIVASIYAEMYSILSDPATGRFYWSGKNNGGLSVYDINTLSILTGIPYGSAVSGSRTGLWKILDQIYALDIDDATISVLDTAVLLPGAIYLISAIPSAALYFGGGFNLMESNGRIMVIQNGGLTANLALYNLTLSVLLSTITIFGAQPVVDWGGGEYIQSFFNDVANGKLYIYDVGSRILTVIDSVTDAIISFDVMVMGSGAGYDYMKARFILDPITGDLYMCLDIVDTTNAPIAFKIYTLDRSTGAVLVQFIDVTIIGDLVRQGLTPFMWAADPGLKFLDGGAYATDGRVAKYTH